MSVITNLFEPETGKKAKRSIREKGKKISEMSFAEIDAFRIEREEKRKIKKQTAKEEVKKVLRLSPRELFQQTMTVKDFAELGVRRENLVAFMIYAEVLLGRDRTMDIAHLRHFECTKEEMANEEIEGFFVSRRKFLQIVSGLSEEAEEKAKEYIGDYKVIEVTKELLRVSGLSIIRISEFIGMSSLAKKISLKDEDLVCLGLPKKAREYFNEKQIILTLLNGQSAPVCKRAQFCKFLERCTRFAQDNMGKGLKYFSCDQCELFLLDQKMSESKSFVQETSAGVSDYGDMYSLGYD
ncbi:MAG: hypothetical protein ACD_9C00175G0002 [uncultured bacterium]|nr:MAG: hypothetical protein ACD_9C00175G0002 [uncultured bacterium]